MKQKIIFWIGMCILIVALAGCNQAAPTPIPVAEVADPAAGGPPGSPAGDLDGTNRLALATMKLEETDHAVTPAQAAELLPLWQLIQDGSLQGMEETNAVLRQIEDKMTDAQLAAIDGMGLTMQDVQAWMEAQGIEMAERPGVQGGAGVPGASQDLSEEERAQMRQKFQNMTPEERATRMAEMGAERPQGGAGDRGGGPGFGGMGRGGNALLAPLIDLLTERVAQ